MNNATNKLWTIGLLSAVALTAVGGVVLPKVMERRSSYHAISAADAGRKLQKEAALPGKVVEQGATVLLTEDFSKCTRGSESVPDSEGIVGELPSSLTNKSGWLVATGRQAGGCMYIDTWQTTQNGETINVSLIDTPVLGASGKLVRVSFRARSKDAAGANLYVINANKDSGSSLSVESVSITEEWQPFEVFVTGCESRSFLEFQTDNAPYFIDDIEVEEIENLGVPQVLPATNITPESYTANWTSVSNATGYMLYPRTMHVSDGLEPFWIINTDFSAITEGTIETPIEPTYVIYSLDEYVDRAGWLVRLPLMANSALGLTNKYLSSYGNSLLQSPTLNLAGGNGSVNVSLRYLAQDVDMFQVSMYQVNENGSVSLRATKMVYTGEEYNVWKDYEFSLGGGTSSSMLVILLPETTSGTVFFDKIEMSQTLEEGTRYTVPGATITTSDVSATVLTPDAGINDSRSYSIKAYRIIGNKSIVSEESSSIIVGQTSPEKPETLDTPAGVSASVNGSQFHASWTPVENANAYEVQLFRRHNSNGNETVSIVDENFDAIRVGTTDLDYPRAMHEDGYDRLDDFTNVPGWEVFQGFYVDGAVGVLGYWNMLGVGCYMRSPKYDLSGNNGEMTLSLKVGTDYYEQGATVYLAHDDEETGGVVYDDILPLDAMTKGFHPFTTAMTGGRSDSYFVFYPYGYGVSYFDDVLVTQRIPAGISDTRVSHRIVNTPEVTMTVPQVNVNDEYFFTVRAVWLDNLDNEQVGSEQSEKVFLEGLVPSTYYTGTVVDSEGNTISGAEISVSIDGSTAEPLTAVSNRWGLFRVENISRSDVDYTAVVTAPGYRTSIVTGLRFTGLQPVTDATIVLRESTDESVEIGVPNTSADVGALYLQYNNSDTETLYPASLLNLPAGTIINSVSYDGYCEVEKEVKCTITITLANEPSAESYATAVPAIPADEEPFWSGEVILNKLGTRQAPAELLHFEPENGFIYNGGSLRIGLQSRATRNSEFYFLTDSRYPSTSIYRYWSRTPEGEWQMNNNGLPVMRIEYTKATGVCETLVAGSLPYTIRIMEGGIEVTAIDNVRVPVTSVSGIKVADMTLTSGESRFCALVPGIYIVGNIKVIVK